MSIIRINQDRLNYVPSSIEVAGASELNDMKDVNVATALNGQILVFNQISGDWENEDPNLTITDIDGGSY